MLVDKEYIINFFIKLGLRKGDTVLLHGNSMGFSQINKPSNDLRTKFFWNLLFDFVGKQGTVLVPTFTYDFTKNGIYDPDSSQSELGQFSENFRNLEKIKRTHHPIFSFAVKGNKFNNFIFRNNSSCFGNDSIFNIIHKLNIKIICFGCELNSVAFLHYIEEKMKVPYRYYKVFRGKIIVNDKMQDLVVRYYVRKLKTKSKYPNTVFLQKYMKNNRLLKEIFFGRIKVIITSSKKVYKSLTKLLLENKYSLIEK